MRSDLMRGIYRLASAAVRDPLFMFWVGLLVGGGIVEFWNRS